MIDHQSIINYPIDNESTILDLLSYDGVNYWWIIMGGFLTYLDEKHNIREPTGDKLFHRIIQIIFKDLPILIYLTNIIFKNICNLILLFFNNNGEKKSQNNSPIIFLTTLREWDFKQYKKEMPTNIYTGDIMKKILVNDHILLLVRLDISNLRYIMKHLSLLSTNKNENSNTFFINQFYSKNTFKYLNDAIKYFNNVWNTLECNDSWFNNCSQISGVNSQDIKSEMKYFIKEVIPYSIQNYYIGRDVLKTYPQSVCVSLFETSVFVQSWLYACNKYEVPMIGLQHGLIINQPEYFCRFNITNDNDKEHNLMSPIFPEMTLVWGNNEKERLHSNAHYPYHQVGVTGNPRYDKHAIMRERYSKKYLCNKYDINPINKIVLWTTQLHGFSMEENRLYLDEIFTTVSQLLDVTLIIKQHPRETKVHTNLIKKYIKKYSDINVKLVSKTATTTELIYICDLLLLEDSTTGQEAVALNKPIIAIDFRPDAINNPYIMEGVAMGVLSSGQLHQKIVEVLNHRIDNMDKQKEYIAKHMFVIDGKASDRCVHYILSYNDRKEK